MYSKYFLCVVFCCVAWCQSSFAQDNTDPCFASPFCSDSSYNFNNNTSGSAPSGPDYGCLFNEPGPSFYYMEIGTAGTMQLFLSQQTYGGEAIDVDFAIWGPFTDLASGCAEVMSGTIAPIQCSYSPAPTENLGLGLPGGTGPGASTPPAVQVGEVYIVLITNYASSYLGAESAGTIDFNQTGGTGSADCGIVCGLTASNSGPVCLGNSVTLFANNTNTETTFTYFWTGTDGLTGTGQSLTFIPGSAGTSDYSVMSVSAVNDTCYGTTTVTVNPNPEVTIINYAPLYTVCNSANYGLAVANPSPFANYQWYQDDAPIPGATNSSYLATENGTYYVVGSTDAGCNKTSLAVTLVFNAAEVDFDFEVLKGCDMDTVVFTNLSEAGQSWWNYGDGSVPDDTTTNPMHIYTSQANYVVRLKLTDSTGCTDSVIKFVDTRHEINAAFGQSADSICQSGNNTVIFFNQSTGDISSWLWDFGDGETSALQGPTHSYPVAGTYTIRLIVQEAGLPCMDTAYGTIYVDSTPHITVMADRDTVCNGERINFSLDYLQTATLLTWEFGDGSSLVGLNNAPYHSYDNPGSYTVAVKADYPVCDPVTDKIKVLIKPFPVVNLGPDTSLCLNGAPFNLLDAINLNNPDIKWKWNTGDTTAILKIVHPGSYSVEADLNGCKTTDEVIIRKDCYVDVPNAFTPNNDGVNDYFFPRQFLSEGVKAFTLTIFNRWGEKVFETTRADGRGWDGMLNGKEQPVGVYVYIVDVAYKNKASEHYEGNVTLMR